MIFQSFRAPVFTMWERFCDLYGIQTLYESNYKMWTYIRDRDTEGAVGWIEHSMEQCIDGEWKIYYD